MHRFAAKHNITLDTSTPQARRIFLVHVMHEAQRIQAARSVNVGSRILKNPESSIPCLLHLELRIREKVMNLLFDAVGARADLSTSEKNSVSSNIVHAINDILSDKQIGYHQDLNNPRKYQFNLAERNGGFVFKGLDVRQLRKLFVHFDAILEVALPSPQLCPPQLREKWHDITLALNEILNKLCNINIEFTSEDCDELQTEVDIWARKYIDLYGGHEITSYIHDLQSGHITSYLRLHGNIYRYANIGFESCIGVVRNKYHTATQHGGHGGAKGCSFGIVQAMERFFLARIAASLSMMTTEYKEKLINCYHVGQNKINAIRRAKYKEKNNNPLNEIETMHIND